MLFKVWQNATGDMQRRALSPANTRDRMEFFNNVVRQQQQNPERNRWSIFFDVFRRYNDGELYLSIDHSKALQDLINYSIWLAEEIVVETPRNYKTIIKEVWTKAYNQEKKRGIKDPFDDDRAFSRMLSYAREEFLQYTPPSSPRIEIGVKREREDLN